jgi:hypothetical protein
LAFVEPCENARMRRQRTDEPRTHRGKNGAPSASRPRVSVETYKDDPMYPDIVRVVAVDVLVGLGWLTPAQVEAWRFGRVAYLERVIQGNLTRLGRFLRILGFHCHDLNLTASATAYVRWGAGPRTPLRFSKTGNPALERVYARHFVWPGKKPFPSSAPDPAPQPAEPSFDDRD